MTEILAWAGDLIDSPLQQAIDSLPSSLRRVAGYQLGRNDADGRPARAGGGKALFATLALLCGRAAGGPAASAVPAAVAVQLLHDALLLHDDIIDQDSTRRGRPTAWKVFGTSRAMLAGTALYAQACTQLGSLDQDVAADCVRIFNASMIRVMDGQARDLALEEHADAGLDECRTMVAAKTGELANACLLGTRSVCADPDRLREIKAFGDFLGLAYQITDDLLDVWGDPAVTGKSAHSDLAARKKTLPVVAALRSGTPAGAAFADLYRRDSGLSPTELAHAADLIEQAGSRRWAHEQQAHWLSRAHAHLHRAVPDPTSAAELRALTQLMISRDH
ncbi:dimethylallyltransferase [Streptomyces mashuensis]|uniref:Dimethylallyltransferase n=1 Tax=Streptomyces mashuensis TaxID=33904 RepID=A0A919AVB7_9ACTN|nr:polyprenyl synthetase family protein [Streptomyces mashuensis]GHF25289.1 dimethylallyltransferase [Streptomyces mashuensis]